MGNSVAEIWDDLLNGKSGIHPIESFDAQGFDCTVAAQANCLVPAEMGIHPRDSRIMDKHSLMLMKCTQDAYNQANLDTQSIRSEEIGFFAGMGMVDYDVESLLPAILKSIDSTGNIDYDAFYSHGYEEIYPLWPLAMLNNISFCQVAINLDLKGENSVFSPVADSGAQAMIEGFNTILDKKARVVLAGGVSEKVSPLSLARAHISGIVNIADDANEALCRPFSSNRKGTILGEGCGMVAMELRSSADDRGMPYSSKITGYGFAFEGNDDASGPSPHAISRSMENAIDRAGLQPSDIAVVIAHGDGTHHGDKSEIKAINQVFSNCVHDVKVFSSKGALGHLLAGAPAIDIILASTILQSGIIPATLNTNPRDKDILFDLLSENLSHKHPKRIMVNCQSLEGQSISLIIESVD